MKPNHELTRLGLLRRLRELAIAALPAYGLAGASLASQHYSGNAVFRADAAEPATVQADHGLYAPNRYNLRILSIGHTDIIASELTWLAALREANLTGCWTSGRPGIAARERGGPGR